MTFFLCRGEKQSGPHTVDELRALAKGQHLSNSDLLWRDGWDCWRPVAEVPGVLTPELPAQLSQSDVLAKQPATKRLDITWERRIEERSKLPGTKTSPGNVPPSASFGAADFAGNSQNAPNLTATISVGREHSGTEFSQPEIIKRTKVSNAAIIYWVAYVSILAGVLLFGIPGGALTCKAWSERRVYSCFVKRRSFDQFFTRIYLPSLWSYAWRSFLTIATIGIGYGALSGMSAEETGRGAGVLFAPWLLSWLFVPFIPLFVRKRLKKNFGDFT